MFLQNSFIIRQSIDKLLPSSKTACFRFYSVIRDQKEVGSQCWSLVTIGLKTETEVSGKKALLSS